MKTSITKKDSEQLRILLIERVQSIVKETPVALAMSGGIDSMTIFFSLLELDIPFECFIFHQDNIISEDLQASISYCKQFHLKLNTIILPSDINSVYNDIKKTIPFCGEKILKTKIECLRPLMYLFDSCPFTQILNGSSADDYQPYKRKVSIAYKNGGESSVLPFRKSVDLKPDAFDVLSRKLAKSYNKEFINVYADKKIEDFYLQFTLNTLLKPHKALTVSAFKDYFDRIGGARIHSSYQINAGINKIHEQLLTSKYNVTNSKNMIGIYNHIAKELNKKKGFFNGNF